MSKCSSKVTLDTVKLVCERKVPKGLEHTEHFATVAMLLHPTTNGTMKDKWITGTVKWTTNG